MNFISVIHYSKEIRPIANKPDPKPVLTRILFEAALFSAIETEADWEEVDEEEENPELLLPVDELPDTLTVETVVDSTEWLFLEEVELDSLDSAPIFLAAVPERVVIPIVVVEPMVAISVVMESVSSAVVVSPLEIVVEVVVAVVVLLLAPVSTVSSESQGIVVMYV